MALDSNRAAKWFVDKCLGDGTLQTLLGASGNVFRDPIPPGVALPAIAVGVQATGPRNGAILKGPNTHTSTSVTVRSSIWDINSYTRIEEVADRLDEIFDGAAYEAFADGYMWACQRLTDIPRTDNTGDDTYLGWDILWRVTVKAD
jgi:hypothetical protein